MKVCTEMLYLFPLQEIQVSEPIKEISFKRIQLQDELGCGTFIVYRAKLHEKQIAVKAMRMKKSNPPREVTIHQNLLPHKNILSPLGVAYNPDPFQFSYICMELAECSLFQRLHDSKTKPTVEQSTEWSLQIAHGMQHLHHYNIIHRDLKSHNVLVCTTGNVKLCDFGCAKWLEHTAPQSQVMGTHRWIAPEIHENAEAKINKACDVFSYGMVLYELFEHQIPFHHIGDSVKVITLIRQHKRPRIPPSVPQHLKHLMQACWEYDSHHRPEFQAIVRAQETKVFTHEVKTPQIPEPPLQANVSFSHHPVVVYKQHSEVSKT